MKNAWMDWGKQQLHRGRNKDARHQAPDPQTNQQPCNPYLQQPDQQQSQQPQQCPPQQQWDNQPYQPVYSQNRGYNQQPGDQQQPYYNQQTGYNQQQPSNQWANNQQQQQGPCHQQQPYYTQQQQPDNQQQQPDYYKQGWYNKQGEYMGDKEPVTIVDSSTAYYQEEDDLASLLRSMEQCNGDINRAHGLVEEWITRKEQKIKKWLRGVKSGAGVQTFGLGLVTFGFGPIPINMTIMAKINKHIVHTFTLDDDRVDNYVKGVLGYGASQVAKKMGSLVGHMAFAAVGIGGGTGAVPMIGPAISATVQTHKMTKLAKQVTAQCVDVCRDICNGAIRTQNFHI